MVRFLVIKKNPLGTHPLFFDELITIHNDMQEVGGSIHCVPGDPGLPGEDYVLVRLNRPNRSEATVDQHAAMQTIVASSDVKQIRQGFILDLATLPGLDLSGSPTMRQIRKRVMVWLGSSVQRDDW